jgi:hypothetical protein
MLHVPQLHDLPEVNFRSIMPTPQTEACDPLHIRTEESRYGLVRREHRDVSTHMNIGTHINPPINPPTWILKYRKINK